MFLEIAFHHLPLPHWTLTYLSQMFYILLSTESLIGEDSHNIGTNIVLTAILLNCLCIYIYSSTPYPLSTVSLSRVSVTCGQP